MFRSHAGKVKNLVEHAFYKDEYSIVPSGGAGYKTLQLINGSAGLFLIFLLKKCLKWYVYPYFYF